MAALLAVTAVAVTAGVGYGLYELTRDEDEEDPVAAAKRRADEARAAHQASVLAAQQGQGQGQGQGQSQSQGQSQGQSQIGIVDDLVALGNAGLAWWEALRPEKGDEAKDPVDSNGNPA